MPRLCSWLLLGYSLAWTAFVDAEEKAPRADNAKVQRLIEKLDSPKFLERQAAAGELRKIGEPAVPALREAARRGSGLELRRRAEGLLRTIQQDKLDRLVNEATHAETAEKDFKKAAAVWNRIIDEGKQRLAKAKDEASGDDSALTDAYIRLARVHKKLGDFVAAARAYGRAVYYSNYNNARRQEIEAEAAALVAGLMPTWEKAVREKIAKDPALAALARKYPPVILHSRRFAGGGYLQSAYSFIYETANPEKHGNDVHILFDNGPGERTFQINMLTNQKNTAADLGNVDFEVNPVLTKRGAERGGSDQLLAVEGHVYLEKVEDTNGNRLFVLFKIVAVDPQSRYMAFIWRRLPGGKVVRR